MTVDDVGLLFRRNAVPSDYYVLDGGLGAGECYGIEPRDGEWVVYYSERGSKNELRRTPSEDAACRLIVEYVSESMMHRFGRPIALPE